MNESSEQGERLQKVLAAAGVASRRECELLIQQGRVWVDGRAVTQLGTRVDPARQRIEVDGQRIHVEPEVYYLLNKPKGFLSTNHDPSGRPLVGDLLSAIPQRLFSVGRLDKESEGLMLLTNDGDLANRLAHPRYQVSKTYLVQVAGRPSAEDLLKLRKGVWLSDGRVAARKVRAVRTQGQSTFLEIVLAEGRNREVRRMLARLGHKVLRLRRTEIGPLNDQGLKPGEFRKLRADEVASLRRASREPQRGSKAKTSRPKSGRRPRQSS